MCVTSLGERDPSRGRDLPLLYDYFTARFRRLDVAEIAAEKTRRVKGRENTEER